ncbi:hypothetical protein BF17_04965 [Yersinia similis]|uniref:Uncharacterized protein n=1 Tax=Yersinia similis TaxID=367190 RepID=A0ABM5PW95_9GAMM|nr:hypothetical protein BF17_04965 [Yersinia similis]
MLGKLYSGPMAGEYESCTGVAVPSASPLPSTRSQSVSPPWVIRPTGWPFSGIRSHLIANHCRSFRLRQRPLPVL